MYPFFVVYLTIEKGLNIMAEDIEIKEETENESEEAKARKRVYHISKDADDGKWKLFLEKGKTIQKFDTQAEAIARAKELCKNHERSYILHGKTGKIRKQ